MPRFFAVLAVVCTLLLAVIAVELYPIAQAARLTVLVAAAVSEARVARENETTAERNARIAAEADAMVDSFNVALEAAQQSVRSRRSSRRSQAPASPTAK